MWSLLSVLRPACIDCVSSFFSNMSRYYVIAEGYWRFKLSNYYRNLLTVYEIAACDKLRKNVISKRVYDAFT